MPRTVSPAGPKVPAVAFDVDAMVQAYTECLLWTTTDEDGEPLSADLSWSAQAVQSIREDCEAFTRDNASDLATMDPAQAGHDFCLTRNGHGAGFWDRGLGDLGARLTAACRPWGESDAYVGDDGSLYVS